MNSKTGVNECSRESTLLSDCRFSALRENLIMALLLMPGFVAGQLVLGLVVSPNWVLCFGLCLGGFTFAIADGIARRQYKKTLTLDAQH